MHFYYLTHSCQGTQQGTFTQVPCQTFISRTSYMTETHPSDWFILSLKACVYLTSQGWCGYWNYDLLLLSFKVTCFRLLVRNILVNTQTNLTQLWGERLSQAREGHILHDVATQGPTCCIPAKPEGIRCLACELKVGRTRKCLWKERQWGLDTLSNWQKNQQK